MWRECLCVGLLLHRNETTLHFVPHRMAENIAVLILCKLHYDKLGWSSQYKECLWSQWPDSIPGTGRDVSTEINVFLYLWFIILQCILIINLMWFILSCFICKIRNKQPKDGFKWAERCSCDCISRLTSSVSNGYLLVPSSRPMFLKFFRGVTPKISRGTPAYKHEKKKSYKKTVVSERGLLQHFQLPHKNSRNISGYIYNFLRYYKIVTHLFHNFSRNP
jgi:hypothetical protein